MVEVRIQIAAPSNDYTEEELRSLVGAPPVDVIALVSPTPTVIGSCVRYDYDGGLWATAAIDPAAKTWGYPPSALNAVAIASRGSEGAVQLHGVYLTPLPRSAIARLVNDVTSRVSRTKSS